MQPGDHLDGYTILRLIGKGGYGEVWLCRSDAVGDLRALKHISTTSPELLEKEFGAIGSYRKAAARLRSPHLMPVEHVGRTAAGLYYVMPLADGTGGNDPTDPSWQPQTLATLIAERAKQKTWFTCHEIADLMRPVMEALQTLADAGLVHRDVKPDNILFFGDQPCLADISLLDEDSATLTRRGTPGYLTPSWYGGGHPDMYGAAATIYTLLTGNQPDRMGRGAYTAPPQGLASLTPQEAAERKRLHAVIRRAADERVAERYPSFLALAAALGADPPKQVRGNRWVWPGLLAVAVMVLVVSFAVLHSKRQQPVTTTNQETTAQKSNIRDDSADAPVKYSKTGELPRFNWLWDFTPPWVFEDYTKIGRSAPLDQEEHEIRISATNDITYAFLTGQNRQALYILDKILSAQPAYGSQPGISLLRAVLLKRLERLPEMEAELRKACHRNPDWNNLGARIYLLDLLARWQDAEEFLTRIVEQPPGGPGEFEKHAISLLKYRATMRARLGNFAGVLEDKALARTTLGLPPVAALPSGSGGHTTNAPGAGESLDISSYRTARWSALIDEAWQVLETQFPAYAEYLREHPPKPGGK